MASKREKLLLLILVVLLLSALSGVGISLYRERNHELSAQIEKYENQIDEMKKRLDAAGGRTERSEELRTKIASGARGFYFPGETDTYRYGLRIDRIIDSLGLTIGSCRNVSKDGAQFLEYSLSGDVLLMSRLIEKLSSADKYNEITQLSLKTGTSAEGDLLLRIAYCEVDIPDDFAAYGADPGHEIDHPLRDSKSYAEPSAIARMFGWSPPVVLAAPAEPDVFPEAPAAEPVPEPVPEPPPAAATWLSFVGRFTGGDGATVYFLKDTRSGRVEKAAAASANADEGWLVLAETDRSLLLEKDGKKYFLELK